jgi:hypothetical protein
VQGFRVTVDFIPHDGSDLVAVSLPNAASTADVHKATKELTEDPSRLMTLFEEAAR